MNTIERLEKALSILKSLGNPVSLAEVGRVAEVQKLLERVELPEITAYACASMYDPKGNFLPGKIVIWSGHYSLKDAQNWLTGWDKYLNRPEDPWLPITLRLCPLHLIKPQGAKFDKA
jgi:hypothetical protein